MKHMSLDTRSLMTRNTRLLTWKQASLTRNRSLIVYTRSLITYTRSLITYSRSLMTWNTRLLTWEQAPVTWNRSLITCNSRLCHELGLLSHTLGLLWHEIHVFWHGNRRLFKHVRNFFFGRQRKFSLDVRDVRKNISNRTSETSFFRAHPWELWSDPCGVWLVAWLKILRALRAQASYGYSPPCIFRLICIGFIVVLFRRQTKLNSVICMTWRIRIRDMTCLYMWRESIDTFSLNCIGFTVCCSVTKQNWILSYVWHDLFIFVTWRIHMCDMTQSHVWHDTFICVTRRIYVCDMAHSYAWSDSIISFYTKRSWGVSKLFCSVLYTSTDICI